MHHVRALSGREDTRNSNGSSANCGFIAASSILAGSSPRSDYPRFLRDVTVGVSRRFADNRSHLSHPLGYPNRGVRRQSIRRSDA